MAALVRPTALGADGPARGGKRQLRFTVAGAAALLLGVVLLEVAVPGRHQTLELTGSNANTPGVTANNEAVVITTEDVNSANAQVASDLNSLGTQQAGSVMGSVPTDEVEADAIIGNMDHYVRTMGDPYHDFTGPHNDIQTEVSHSILFLLFRPLALAFLSAPFSFISPLVRRLAVFPFCSFSFSPVPLLHVTGSSTHGPAHALSVFAQADAIINFANKENLDVTGKAGATIYAVVSDAKAPASAWLRGSVPNYRAESAYITSGVSGNYEKSLEDANTMSVVSFFSFVEARIGPCLWAWGT